KKRPEQCNIVTFLAVEGVLSCCLLIEIFCSHGNVERLRDPRPAGSGKYLGFYLRTNVCVASPRSTSCVRFTPAALRPAISAREGGTTSPSRGAATAYSITSSARASTEAGSSIPSALAVLRLMTSSYLTGA